MSDIAGTRYYADRVGSPRAAPDSPCPPPAAAVAGRRCGARVRLLREFRYEQPDPARFYTALADDSVEQLGQLRRPATARRCSTSVAGPATSAPPSRRRRDLLRPRRRRRRAGRARATSATGHRHRQRHAAAVPRRLPSTSATPPTCSSTCRDPWRMADEMLRVTRPGGIVSSATRSGSARGAATRPRPWHFLGGRRARRRYAAHARPRAQEQVRRVAVRGHRRGRPALGRDARQAATSSHVLPRYNPWWSRWLLRVPILREVVTWNLVIVLRKRGRG